jgi:ATP-dependent 26S proteasome regulatory subunit
LAHLGVNDTNPGDTNTHPFEQFPFLAGYHAMLRTFVPGNIANEAQDEWWEEYILRWEAQATTPTRDMAQAHKPLHLPLKALREEMGLSLTEVLLLIATGLVEEDIRFGTLFAALQAPLTARRPCLGVLSWLMSASISRDNTSIDTWTTCRTLLDAGLLHVENATDPRAEWVLRVPAPIWDAIRGYPDAKSAGYLSPSLLLPTSNRERIPTLNELILPEILAERVLHLPNLLTKGLVQTVVLRGMSGSGRRTILRAVAHSLNRQTLLWEGDKGKPGEENWRLLGPLATLAGAIPILRFDPAPGETLDLPGLPGYAGPVGITLGRSGGLRGPLMTHALSLNVPAPDKAARHRFWEATQVTMQPNKMDSIVSHFLLTGGHIHKTATLAQAYAALDNREAITASDVRQASRVLNRQALETLATELEPAHGWSDLVTNNATIEELHALETRCRNREMLRQHTGPALRESVNRGVRALFSGPSGTGKTLAARVLAAVLQMDVYRVDLAAVVNKYIGETERNLNHVLSRAEELDVVLLLDEGDALMTNRTDVRNANDRYANLETNYLLQRLETYEGIVIITTNAGNRIDNAFLRRIDAIVDFVQPGAAERWQIWQSHLPTTHTIQPAFLQEVTTRCVLTGGQIRNAALHATLLAVESAESVNNMHVEKAVQREYRKAGAACPLRSR